jgi:hypothetical protein
MTDTRYKSQRGDYELEQSAHFGQIDYKLKYGNAVNTYLPGNGLIGQRNVGRSDLANNSCDIESMLRGIGSCNMVNPQAEIVPDIRQLKQLHIFESQPTFVPDPLVVHKNQRPQWQ